MELKIIHFYPDLDEPLRQLCQCVRPAAVSGGPGLRRHRAGRRPGGGADITGADFLFMGGRHGAQAQRRRWRTSPGTARR